MGDTSRKVNKNPLLSAAGISFPFEDFTGSALLMPVTPATPSILQDDSEIASFVGQQPHTNTTPSLTSYPTDFNLGSNPNSNIEHHQHHPHNPAHHHQQQIAPPTSEVFLTPINEPRELTSDSQPQKQQGYLSSLLSSLPNISLASIKGEKEDQPSKSAVKDQPPASSSSEYGLYPPFYSPSDSYAGGGPPIARQENSPYEFPPAPGTTTPWYSPDNTTRGLSASGFATPPANVPPTLTPPVQPPPVALPPTGVPSSSYRLGNQRRLKYAPSPDLQTSNSRANNLPLNLPPQPTFPSAPPPALFQQQRAPQVVQNPPFTGFPGEPSQSLNRESARSSPISASSPQNIPPRISSIESELEPATPQNTPANPNQLLASFGPLPGSEGGWKPSAKTPPKNGEEDALKEIDLNEASPASGSFRVTGSVPEATVSGKESPPSSSSPFAPISAARVSEKLENFLASRKEEVGEASELPELPSALEKSGIFSVNPSNPVVAEDPVLQLARGSNEEKKATSGYFAPQKIDQTPIPSFYDPTKFQGQAAPVPASIFEPKTASAPPQPAAVANSGQNPGPTFYNPYQFSANVDANIKPQFYPNPVGSFAPVAVGNPQSYFYPGNSKIGDNKILHGDSTPAAAYFSPPSPPMAAAAVPEPTGSATLDPIQMSVNPLGNIGGNPSTVDNGFNNLPPSLHNLASGNTSSSIKQMTYRPVYQHWFHRKEVETKVLWLPFSMQDSLNLEEVHNSTEITPETTVATDGGRYDVDILRRLRTPVYWSGTPNEVRRCSWFYKGPAESRYVPYEENVAARLEEEFQQACNSDIWNRRIELNNGEYIIFHSPTVQVHYLQPGSPELTASWGNNAGSEDSTYLQGAATRPRVVKRGVDEFNIDQGEPDQVDHLLFLVHGIGSVCDLKFRSVEEVVDEFRSISLQLVQSHYRSASEQGTVHKIEVLPISWHTTLHSDDTGIDKKLQAITLESIPKLRHFTNDTLSDILFYTSPIYCQTIMQTVGNEMNRLFALFKKRNPRFEGGVYVGGHSLGSLILFDLLCHQKPPSEEEIHEEIEEEKESGTTETKEDTVAPIRATKMPVLKRRLSKKISYVMGAAGTGQPYINYPQLSFNPSAFFALGSPIGMFVTVRGIDTLGEDFALPTCPAFFNIFHPFDPVAYRVEALIHPDASKFRPKLIPHHKGRKRMHLELKETMARVGADLKQKLLDSVRSTWNSVYQLAMFHRPDNQALEREIDKVVEEQLQSASNEPETSQSQIDDSGDDVKIGKLNGGRRVDYVLQEAPFEYINEYIFALTSHVCYWESEDTMLMMLKEIYGSMGIQSDAQLPQQTLTIERASPFPGVMPPVANTNNALVYNSNSISSGGISTLNTTVAPPRFDGKTSPSVLMGMDPTAPITEKPIGPPPTSGFMRKS